MSNKAAYIPIHKLCRFSIYGFVAFVLIAGILMSCETGGITGDYIDNQPPYTFMTIADMTVKKTFDYRVRYHIMVGK